jgi:hypothetical protein
MLKTIKSFDNYYNIMLAQDRSGWVASNRVTPKKLPGYPDIPKIVLYKMTKHPPKISLAHDSQVPFETESGAVTIKGNLTDENPLKDLYVFVNNKKVFYKSFKGEEKKASSLNFAVSVALEDGTNNIVLVARDDSDIAQRAYLTTSKIVPGKFLTLTKEKITKEDTLVDD